uniref:Uncharacterized protein n=1 Tax=Oryza brachyantha TaxID=4533 RepID=J3LZV8_ORYBR
MPGGYLASGSITTRGAAPACLRRAQIRPGAWLGGMNRGAGRSNWGISRGAFPPFQASSWGGGGEAGGRRGSESRARATPGWAFGATNYGSALASFFSASKLGLCSYN